MPDAEQLLAYAEELLDRRMLIEALAQFNGAEHSGASPDRCGAGRWMADMLLGRFEEAWRESDAIRLRGAPDPERFWNGESVDGRSVIVRCLHGYGDSVQFLRFIPALRRRAKRVIVQAAPAFLPLARRLQGVQDVITWNSESRETDPKWDVQIEVTELPYLFRVSQGDLPAATNYLDLPADLRSRVSQALHVYSSPRVGVVWSTGEWNLSRAVPLACLEPLLSTPGVAFFNLQGGAVRKEWQHLPNPCAVHDHAEWCDDAGLLPLATFISQLDLVITPDTLAAHLGGALGVPTWVLLQHAADWRWMHSRSDSPWYPSLRLFRQPEPGNWHAAIQNMRLAFSEWLVESRRRVA